MITAITTDPVIKGPSVNAAAPFRYNDAGGLGNVARAV